MITIIYLIRHAAYENPLRIFHGRSPGFPLSAEGKKQAARIAGFLKTKPITAIYSSRLLRARQTAEIIAGRLKLPVWTDERLLDIRSPLQGKPIDYLNALDSYFYHPAFIAAGGETMEALFDRMDHFMRQKASDHPGEHIVIVSHGDGIMTIATKYAGKPLPKCFPYDAKYVGQASGFMIEFITGKKKQKFIPVSA